MSEQRCGPAATLDKSGLGLTRTGTRGDAIYLLARDRHKRERSYTTFMLVDVYLTSLNCSVWRDRRDCQRPVKFGGAICAFDGYESFQPASSLA